MQMDLGTGKASDLYTEDELRELIEVASAKARRGFEEKFMSDLDAKFERFGAHMWLTDKQNAVLLRIFYRD